MRFEEYKLFRDTVTHFDKMLINIRRNAIYFSFTIFAAAMTIITFEIPEGLPIRDTIDLSIILILMDFPLILAFYFLETHYRYYLKKIVQTAAKYEKELKLGVMVEDCKFLRDNLDCNKVASISKCLKCMHDFAMESHIRSANINIYAYLLGIGFITLNVLISIKIRLPPEEILRFSIVTALFTFSILYLYTSRPDKKHKERVEFDYNFWTYRIPIISFMLLTYWFYYPNFDIWLVFIKNNFSYFNSPYLKSFTISSFILLVLIYRKKISDTISGAIKTIVVRLSTLSQK